MQEEYSLRPNPNYKSSFEDNNGQELQEKVPESAMMFQSDSLVDRVKNLEIQIQSLLDSVRDTKKQFIYKYIYDLDIKDYSIECRKITKIYDDCLKEGHSLGTFISDRKCTEDMECTEDVECTPIDLEQSFIELKKIKKIVRKSYFNLDLAFKDISWTENFFKVFREIDKFHKKAKEIGIEVEALCKKQSDDIHAFDENAMAEFFSGCSGDLPSDVTKIKRLKKSLNKQIKKKKVLTEKFFKFIQLTINHKIENESDVEQENFSNLLKKMAQKWNATVHDFWFLNKRFFWAKIAEIQHIKGVNLLRQAKELTREVNVALDAIEGYHFDLPEFKEKWMILDKQFRNFLLEIKIPLTKFTQFSINFKKESEIQVVQQKIEAELRSYVALSGDREMWEHRLTYENELLSSAIKLMNGSLMVIWQDIVAKIDYIAKNLDSFVDIYKTEADFQSKSRGVSQSKRSKKKKKNFF